MAVFGETIHKLYSKLENHHHHHHHRDYEDLSASLQSFKSAVSSSLGRLIPNNLASGSESEILSLPWIQNCFQTILIIHKAFANLAVDIDYPISNWEATSIDEYFSYSSKLLELFNLISSSASHLGKSRLYLRYALSLVQTSPSSAIPRLKSMTPSKFNNFDNEDEEEEYGKARRRSKKEEIIHQALMILRSLGFWICGIVLASLHGDEKPYLKLSKSACKVKLDINNFAFNKLNSSIGEVIKEKGAMVKEVRELNHSVACLVAALVEGRRCGAAAEEMGRKLKVLRRIWKG